MEYPTEFNFKTNELFKPAADSHFNACVGDNGGPYSLANYADGFFDGGHAIVKDVKDGNFKVDVLVYPAAFSFRHGIELYLKHHFQLLAELNGTSPEYPKKPYDPGAVGPRLSEISGDKKAQEPGKASSRC